MTLRIDPSVGNPACFRELDYVRGIAESAAAQASWPQKVTEIAVVSAHPRHTAWPTIDRLAPPRVVVALSAERGTLPPALRATADVVLGPYLSEDNDTLPIPLGPSSFVPPSTTPWGSRDVDVVFVGHLHRGRVGLARGLGAFPSPLNSLPDVVLAGLRRLARPPVQPALGLRTHLAFTQSFGGGLSGDDYSRLLARSRVALVPPGFHHPETFRHHEAARAGCVLVGQPLRSVPLPVVPVSDWSRIYTVIEGIFEDIGSLETRHDATRKAWQHHASPEAVGAALAPRVARALQAR